MSELLLLYSASRRIQNFVEEVFSVLSKIINFQKGKLKIYLVKYGRL